MTAELNDGQFGQPMRFQKNVCFFYHVLIPIRLQYGTLCVPPSEDLPYSENLPHL
jgi:hypothetical protein